MRSNQDKPLSEVLPKNIKIPTIPVVVQKINQLIANPDAGTAEIGELISQDAPLAAKVLRIANSAYYGLTGKCVSTKHACTVLGVRVLKNLVMQVSVMKQFAHLEGTDGFDVNAMWDHAILTAQVNRSMAQKARRMTILTPEEHYVCGLVHDVGKIVLLDGLKDKYASIARVAKQTGRALHEVEAEVLKFDHTDVGAVVATRWDLPPAVVDAIQYHHGPMDKVMRSPVLALVAVANQVAHYVERDQAELAGQCLNAETQELLGLQPHEVVEVVGEILDRREEAA